MPNWSGLLGQQQLTYGGAAEFAGQLLFGGCQNMWAGIQTLYS